ncbi:MAG: hypothetical protein HZB16_22030 [Armatimonadetes bacterium]|nr:hypothetical protein [Armatimonadota bacterium]
MIEGQHDNAAHDRKRLSLWLGRLGRRATLIWTMFATSGIAGTVTLAVKWLNSAQQQHWFPYWPMWASIVHVVLIFIMSLLTAALLDSWARKPPPGGTKALRQFALWWCLFLASFFVSYLYSTISVAHECSRATARRLTVPAGPPASAPADLLQDKYWAAARLNRMELARAACPTELPYSVQAERLKAIYEAVGIPTNTVRQDVLQVAGSAAERTLTKIDNVVGSYLGNLPGLFAILCFAVLYLRRPVTAPICIIIGVCSLLTPTAVAVAQFALGGPWTVVADIADRSVGTISLALLVGRLDSRAISPPLSLLVVLYGYVAIQPLLVLPDTLDAVSPMIKPVIYILAMLGKVTLFLVVYWALDSGVLHAYFRDECEADRGAEPTRPTDTTSPRPTPALPTPARYTRVTTD